MFLKLTLAFVIGLGGYFYFQSQLGPEALTKHQTEVFRNEQAAMHISKRGDDDYVTSLEENTYVIIVEEVESRSWSVCRIEVKEKSVGWIRCADLKKI